MRFLSIFLVVLLTACSSANIDQYAENQPQLILEEFFNGKLIAHGVLRNRGGDVIRHFSATINASWQNGIGRLDEHFVFSDGEKQQRIWTLTKQVDGTYLAKANDVIGEHPMSIAGNTLFMRYVLDLPYKDGTLAVSVDDKMFLVTEDRILNESVFYKWGFKVASVQLTIEKHSYIPPNFIPVSRRHAANKFSMESWL